MYHFFRKTSFQINLSLIKNFLAEVEHKGERREGERDCECVSRGKKGTPRLLLPIV